MIFLYILLGVIALICLILFINVHLVLIYDQGAKAYIRVLFFKISAKKLVKKLSGEKKENKLAKQAQTVEKQEVTKQKKTKGSISDFLEFISLIAKIIKRALKDLFRHLHINLKSMEIRFTAGDADKTALAYGASIQAANGLFALLQRFTHVKWNDSKLILAPDFTGENNVFNVHLDLRIKPVFLLSMALRALLTYLEGKDKKHERNPVKTSH